MAEMTQEEARMRARLPAVASALREIASGRIIVSQDGKNGWLEEQNGEHIRDTDTGRKMIVPGVITLIKAGYLTPLCVVTAEGRQAAQEPSNV